MPVLAVSVLGEGERERERELKKEVAEGRYLSPLYRYLGDGRHL